MPIAGACLHALTSLNSLRSCCRLRALPRGAMRPLGQKSVRPTRILCEIAVVARAPAECCHFERMISLPRTTILGSAISPPRACQQNGSTSSEDQPWRLVPSAYETFPPRTLEARTATSAWAASIAPTEASGLQRSRHYFVCHRS
jgi:hypothetical protein